MVLWLSFQNLLPNNRYWERMDAAGVVGKTPAQVAALVGPPDAQFASWNGDTTEVFYGPLGARFAVNFRRGVAISTSHRTHP